MDAKKNKKGNYKMSDFEHKEFFKKKHILIMLTDILYC